MITQKIIFAFFKLERKFGELVLLLIIIVLASLFAYTAYEKLMDHERFMNGIARVAVIGRFAHFISWSVPLAELIVAGLLLIPKTARKGLWAFLGLMLVFSVYILTSLIWASKLPCHCGGVIETLSWTEHLFFNMGFIILSIIAIRLKRTINSSITKIKIMNNIKKMIIGFGAVAMIVSFSAFKDMSKTLSVPKAVKAGAITADYLVQPIANQYREFGLPGSPSPSNCEDPAVRQCYYHVTTDGKSNIPTEPVDGYTATQIQTYLDNEWLEVASGSSAALYNGSF